MEASVTKKSLPPRPNLDHLRRQAKSLLAELNAGAATAARAFIEHLPDARTLTPARTRAAGFRLADAQSVVARQTGFASWPALGRHVEQLRALEGEWHFTSLEVDGRAMPTHALTRSRILIDGDRFRTESPEGTYEGVFTIDVEASPSHIDIEFVEGPEAGSTCFGLFELSGHQLTLCLGLVGSSRPARFATQANRGHALERLQRVSTTRPGNVTGGAPRRAAPVTAAPVDPGSFDGPLTPMLKRLAGEWTPVRLVQHGAEMDSQWLQYGLRTTTGNEVKVVFGGQVMLEAKVRLDESAEPIAVDYLNLRGAQKGTISLGIMEWRDEDVRFLIASPGEPRPTAFVPLPATGIFSEWRRRGPS
jgi:uncharacterized protein (TIGR03067 family)